MKLISLLNEIKVLRPNPFKPNTPEWWFYKLPEPYRTQAITNFRNDPNYEIEKKEEYDSLLEAILYPLEWSNTPEGPYYWEVLFDKLVNNQPLNEIKVAKPNPFEQHTAEWWFYQLPQPYRNQALNNFKNETDEQYILNKNETYDNIGDATMYSFNWRHSPEGWAYWMQFWMSNKI